jgi:hypothetical protein
MQKSNRILTYAAKYDDELMGEKTIGRLLMHNNLLIRLFDFHLPEIVDGRKPNMT